jgi:predicted DNA-binding transcriptional regulator YafY
LKTGGMLMSLTVADSRELVGWVLSFGSGVRVVRPDSLRAAVQTESRRIFHAALSRLPNGPSATKRLS